MPQASWPKAHHYGCRRQIIFSRNLSPAYYLYENSCMKKMVLLIIVLVIAGLVGWKLLSKKEAPRTGTPDQALKISKNTGPFNTAFAGLLNDYYALKDALVVWDTVKADQAAYALALRTDSLPVNLIKGDSDIVNTAKSLIASVGSEAKGIVGE